MFRERKHRLVTELVGKLTLLANRDATAILTPSNLGAFFPHAPVFSMMPAQVAELADALG